jgi:hypothetical protein
MEESLDAEPRLFVGQVRAEREGREGGREEREKRARRKHSLYSHVAAAKKRGKSVDEWRLLARAGTFPWPYFFLG